MEHLAILGGPAAYPDGLRLLRPTLPAYGPVGARWSACFDDGTLTKGAALAEYEHLLAEHLGVRHALGVSSCTAGLMLALDRHRGGTAVLPSFTFMATAMAAAWAGLKLRFCDVHPETWCLDPETVTTVLDDDSVDPDRCVVVPVHVYGTPADTDAFDEIGRRYGVPVVYDAAHGFGALRRGRPVGAQGSAQVFSTSPTKLLITGEGGVVATDDDATARHVSLGREYGNPGDYDALFPGINARLPEAGAILGIESLKLLETEAVRRNRLAGLYRERLGDLPGVTFQRVDPDDRCSYKDLSLTVDHGFGISRDQLVRALAAEGIPTRTYYVPPAHRLRAFSATQPTPDDHLPVTRRLTATVVSLPLYGSLSDDDVVQVADLVRTVHRHAADVGAALTRTRPDTI